MDCKCINKIGGKNGYKNMGNNGKRSTNKIGVKIQIYINDDNIVSWNRKGNILCGNEIGNNSKI
jgi:hypothetical protein